MLIYLIRHHPGSYSVSCELPQHLLQFNDRANPSKGLWWPINMEILRMSPENKKQSQGACYWRGDQTTVRNVPQNTLSSLIKIGYNALVLNSKHMLKHFKV